MRQNHDSVVMRLTESQLEEFRETFNAFDKDMGGTIDGDELGDLMRTLGQEPTEVELEKMIKLADADGSGDIDFAEFTVLIAHKMKDDDGSLKEQKLKQAFAVFDTDGSGFIDSSEMRRIMINLGENISTKDVDEILKEFDRDGDGQISPDEVCMRCPRFIYLSSLLVPTLSLPANARSSQRHSSRRSSLARRASRCQSRQRRRRDQRWPGRYGAR